MLPELAYDASDARPFPERSAPGEDRFRRIYDLTVTLSKAPDLQAALKEVVAASMDLVGAEGGYIRLFENPGRPFVAPVGFSDRYMKYFSALDNPVDPRGRSKLSEGNRLIIEDIRTHPPFA